MTGSIVAALPAAALAPLRQAEPLDALLRWHHPALGMVPPDAFIPIAEWIVRQACHEAWQWAPELKISQTAIISDKLRALHCLRQIKGMGVSVAIDGFGTG